MCSWCWGFAPERDKLRAAYPEAGFELVVGGLRPGTEEPWDAEMRQFLREHWVEIKARTGQPFKLDLLEEEDFTYDTLPAAEAVALARQIDPKKGWSVFKALQKAFYGDNRRITEFAVLKEVLAEEGIDAEVFTEKWEADTEQMGAKTDFAIAQKLGVRSFPTLLLFLNDTWQIVTLGYRSASDMQRRVEQYLEKAS